MQRHEMIDAMRALGLKGMAGAFDEAVGMVSAKYIFNGTPR